MRRSGLLCFNSYIQKLSSMNLTQHENTEASTRHCHLPMTKDRFLAPLVVGVGPQLNPAPSDSAPRGPGGVSKSPAASHMKGLAMTS